MSFKNKFTAAAVAISLALAGTGCSSSGGFSLGGSDSNVNPELKKDEPSFFSKSGAVACVGGAALAGLSCLLLKKDKKALCLAAAAAGCTVGMTGNYMLDKLRANYSNLEDQLDATKAKVQDSLKSTQSLQASVNETLASDEAEIQQIENGIKDGTKTKADLEKKADEMSKNLAYMQERLKADKENLQAQTDALQGLKDGKGGVGAIDTDNALKKQKALEEEIAKTNESINALEGAIADYSEKTLAVKNKVNGITTA